MSDRPRSSRASAGRLMATWLNRGWRFFFAEASVMTFLSNVGDDEHLARQLSAGQLLDGVQQTREGDVLRLDQQVDWEGARSEQAESGGEAAAVVVVRAGDLQLVEQDSVVVETGGVHPRADQDEPAAPAQLAQACCHGVGAARALQHGIEGV